MLTSTLLPLPIAEDPGLLAVGKGDVRLELNRSRLKFQARLRGGHAILTGVPSAIVLVVFLAVALRPQGRVDRCKSLAEGRISATLA
jgi:hypothetical protein